MNLIRGVFMFAIGCYAIYVGWQAHTGQRAVLAYLLGVLAIGLGVWRLTRKPPARIL